MIRRLIAQTANLRWRRLRPLLAIGIVLGVLSSTVPCPPIYAAPVPGAPQPASAAPRQAQAPASGSLAVNPAALDVTLKAGQTASLSLTVSNAGAADYSFTLVERPGRYLPTGGPPGAVAPPAGSALAAGDVIQTWQPAQNPQPWGIAYTAADTVWVGNGVTQFHADAYAPDGTYTGPSYTYAWSPLYAPGDFTYNANTDMLWVMDVWGDECIHELDPAAGATGATICPLWNIAPRGLAYDPRTDTYFGGSWNYGMIYHVDASGALLQAVSTDIDIAGLAYNPDSGHLFAVDKNAPARFWVLDPARDFAVLSSFLVPGFHDSGGSGLEIGCDGSLWAVAPVQHLVYQISSGESSTWCYGDLPWLSTDPVTGVVPSGGAVTVAVNFDAGAVDQPGEYHAKLALKNDSPGGTITIPLTMTVQPLPSWGRLQGVVSGLGVCDGAPAPLADAEVTLQASSGVTVTLHTDLDGVYSRWVDSAGSPYTLAAAAPGHVPSEVSNIQVAGGEMVTADLGLRLLAPCLSADPAALTTTVDPGGSATGSLLLRNTGAGDGAFRLVPLNRGRQLAALAQPLAAGGPDAFGYTFRDSNQADGPLYDWIEISPRAGGDGTAITALYSADGGVFFPLPLPFPFNFYGTDYTQMAVSADGTLYFTSGYIGSGNTSIPSDTGGSVKRFLAPFWGDLLIEPGGIYYKDLGDRFVIEYNDVSLVWPDRDPGTWQAVLYADGSILFQYRDLDFGDSEWNNGAEETVGIQGDPTTGLQYSYNSPALAAGLAICFAYPGRSETCGTTVPWLDVSPLSGVLAAGEQAAIALAFDASVPTVDQPGDYTAELQIESSSPDQPPPAAVTMRVAAPAGWGRLSGTVRSLGTCNAAPVPLRNAAVTIIGAGSFSQTLKTDGGGGYALWAAAADGPFTVTAVMPDHEAQQAANIALAPGGSTQADFDLRWLRACLAPSTTALEMWLTAGAQGTQTLQLANSGAAPAEFTFQERAAAGLAPAAQAAGVSPAAGAVLRTWKPAPNSEAWGVAQTPDGAVWVSHMNGMGAYAPDGTYRGPTHSYPSPNGADRGDLAYNARTGRLWVMGVGGANCIGEVDPATGFTGEAICPTWGPPPLGGTYPHGLAYDPSTGDYYAAGGSDGRLYHFDASGAILDSFFFVPQAAGLAYNPDTQHLFVMEYGRPIQVSVFKAHKNYALFGTFAIPGAPGVAGLELGCDGSLWATGQGTVYQVESGEETSLCGGDIPWLSLAPVSGAVPADGTADITVTYDAASLAAGVYTGTLFLSHNTPGSLPAAIAVTLHVAEEPTVVVQPATGGVLTGPVSNQVVTLTVPPGAVNEPVAFRLQTVTSRPSTSGLVGLGLGFQFEAHTLSGDPVTQFAQPLTLIFHYDDADVVGVDESTLQIFYWNEAQGAWVALPTAVDAAANMLTATVDHLTLFAALHPSTTELKLYLPNIQR